MTVEQSSTTSTSKHGDTQTLFTFGPKKLTFGPDLFFYFWVKTLLTFGSKHFWLLDQMEIRQDDISKAKDKFLISHLFPAANLS